jgi:iron-sulfur cluster repair protein YtfE (RIC family)
MQQHNIKEENMLYPMSDRVLGTAADATVKAMQALPQE